MKTAAELMQHVSYDAATGVFVRKLPRRTCGKIAGRFQSGGYRQMTIEGKCYYAHRLAWLFMTGAWPAGQIDHLDGDRQNNRFANLREATASENGQNMGMRSDNKSGFIGVTWSARASQWKAKITINGKQKHISYRDRPQDAYADYLREKAKLHVFQPTPRGAHP